MPTDRLNTLYCHLKHPEHCLTDSTILDSLLASQHSDIYQAMKDLHDFEHSEGK